jgi:tetratricopeptide (TPR) repeat protein
MSVRSVISFTEQRDQVVLDEEALSFIGDDQRISCISIIGPSGSGKSLLLSHLLHKCGINNVSFVSHKQLVRGTTNGVDTYTGLLPFSQLSGVSESSKQVVVFDVEGLGIDSDATMSRLLVPIMMVSQVIIFNLSDKPNMHTVLDKLSMFSEIASQLDSTSSSGSDIGRLFGELALLLRDSGAGETASQSTQYLEALLTDEANTTRDATSRNSARAAIRQCFCGISLVGLSIPFLSIEDWQAKRLVASNVSAAFSNDVCTMMAGLEQHLNDKISISDMLLTGSTLRQHLRGLVASVNKGAESMNIMSLIAVAHEQRCLLAERQLRQQLNSAENTLRARMPCASAKLRNEIASCCESLLSAFHKSTHRAPQSILANYAHEAEQSCRQSSRLLIDENTMAVQRACQLLRSEIVIAVSREQQLSEHPMTESALEQLARALLLQNRPDYVSDALLIELNALIVEQIRRDYAMPSAQQLQSKLYQLRLEFGLGNFHVSNEVRLWMKYMLRFPPREMVDFAGIIRPIYPVGTKLLLAAAFAKDKTCITNTALLIDLARHKESLADTATADALFEQALAIERDTGRDVSGALVAIGILWQSRHDFHKALEYFEQALDAPPIDIAMCSNYVAVKKKLQHEDFVDAANRMLDLMGQLAVECKQDRSFAKQHITESVAICFKVGREHLDIDQVIRKLEQLYPNNGDLCGAVFSRFARCNIKKPDDEYYAAKAAEWLLKAEATIMSSTARSRCVTSTNIATYLAMQSTVDVERVKRYFEMSLLIENDLKVAYAFLQFLDRHSESSNVLEQMLSPNGAPTMPFGAPPPMPSTATASMPTNRLSAGQFDSQPHDELLQQVRRAMAKLTEPSKLAQTLEDLKERLLSDSASVAAITLAATFAKLVRNKALAHQLILHAAAKDYERLDEDDALLLAKARRLHNDFVGAEQAHEKAIAQARSDKAKMHSEYALYWMSRGNTQNATQHFEAAWRLDICQTSRKYLLHLLRTDQCSTTVPPPVDAAAATATTAQAAVGIDDNAQPNTTDADNNVVVLTAQSMIRAHLASTTMSRIDDLLEYISCISVPAKRFSMQLVLSDSFIDELLATMGSNTSEQARLLINVAHHLAFSTDATERHRAATRAEQAIRLDVQQAEMYLIKMLQLDRLADAAHVWQSLASSPPPSTLAKPMLALFTKYAMLKRYMQSNDPVLFDRSVMLKRAITCRAPTPIIDLLLRSDSIATEGMLHVACKAGHTNACRALLRLDSINVNLLDKRGRTPLDIALNKHLVCAYLVRRKGGRCQTTLGTSAKEAMIDSMIQITAAGGKAAQPDASTDANVRLFNALIDVAHQYQQQQQQQPPPPPASGGCDLTQLVELLPPEVDSRAKLAIQQFRCTRSSSGTQTIVQPNVKCLTCGLHTEYGCCVVCAIKCHAGHELVLVPSEEHYCDCPSLTPRNCTANIEWQPWLKYEKTKQQPLASSGHHAVFRAVLDVANQKPAILEPPCTTRAADVSTLRAIVAELQLDARIFVVNDVESVHDIREAIGQAYTNNLQFALVANLALHADDSDQEPHWVSMVVSAATTNSSWPAVVVHDSFESTEAKEQCARYAKAAVQIVVDCTAHA